MAFRSSNARFALCCDEELPAPSTSNELRTSNDVKGACATQYIRAVVEQHSEPLETVKGGYHSKPWCRTLCSHHGGRSRFDFPAASTRPSSASGSKEETQRRPAVRGRYVTNPSGGPERRPSFRICRLEEVLGKPSERLIDSEVHLSRRIERMNAGVNHA